jgi:hypothetical protein
VERQNLTIRMSKELENLKVVNIESGQLDDENDRSRRIIEAGSELVGVTSGAVFGLFAGGPDGAILGAAAGSALTTTLREFAERMLGHREKVRVGAALNSATMMFEERIAAGDHLRDDDWFEEIPKGRSAAAEVFEGTLLIAQREHQERKVEYYGYLLANLSFQSNVDKYLANWLLRLAGELTWSQLVLLAMIGRKDEFILPAITIAHNDAMAWTQWGLHEQLADLGYGQRNLIGVLREVPENKPDGPQFAPAPHISRFLPDMQLTNTAPLIYPLMQLNRISAEDIESMIHLLEPPDE